MGRIFPEAPIRSGWAMIGLLTDRSTPPMDHKTDHLARWVRHVAVAALVLGTAAAQAWSDHALGTAAALADVPAVRDAAPVKVEPIEAFVMAQAPALEQLLAQEEKWAQAHVPTYPPRPEALAFHAAGLATPVEARRRFIAALRLNPQSRLALFLQRLPGQGDDGHPALDWHAVTTLRADQVQSQTRFVALAAGDMVKPLDVVASASDEPDYGLDLGLWEDNGAPASALYGMGRQPFGNPAYEYSGQAPLHMGFYHEAAIVYAAAGFLKRTYPEYRFHLYQTLARFALENGHAYWGWRFAGWALHHVQDLTQPYHARVLPGVGVTRMLWINALDLLGIHGPKNDAVTLVSNRHTALENYQWETMRRAYGPGERADPVFAALRERSHDPAPPWREALLRQAVSQEACDAADALDAVLVATLPARYVSDPGYQVGVTDPALDLAEVMAHRPAQDRARLDRALAARMARFGAYTRLFVSDLVGRAGGRP
jgi:hypothetical protein